MKTHEPLSVAIAGAAGFVGSALAERLAEHSVVIALGRRYPEATLPITKEAPQIVQRRCDLFSLEQTTQALEGADVAVYLVHSMSPNARLTQGAFEDLDLLLADNFARSAKAAGVERIVYLGGLLPPDPKSGMSAHLESRWEVEKALGKYGVPVTAVRAGLVVGAEGSSLNLLVRLVERLPMMVCPSWTSTRTQPIGLADVITILEYCCRQEATAGRVCEVGGPDIMSYREMMQSTARVLGRRRPMIPVPLVTPALSELWVALVTGSPRSLVRPLIESLRHAMVVEDGWLQREMALPGSPFEAALRESVRRSRVWRRPVAQSVQRFSLPPNHDVKWIAEEYPRWLGHLAPALLDAGSDGDVLRLGLRFIRRPLLILERNREAEDAGRFRFSVIGGLLAGSNHRGDPRLEFRATPDGRHVLAALQDFEPRLPWWIYAATQARVHRLVMTLFKWRLARMSRNMPPRTHDEDSRSA